MPVYSIHFRNRCNQVQRSREKLHKVESSVREAGNYETLSNDVWGLFESANY